ncbi:NEDD4-binding protein 2 isoform X1 [Pyxicephalus adspersus]|uniref:NEDD4-binding protein 2 isoform X1 n=1 Tax=Pyxicephalus adspersus TaxID=30357 RepID=UPI003B5CD3A5
MPRKRKSLSLSPQRKTSNPSIAVDFSSSTTLPPPPTMSGNKKEMLSRMCEMFPNLEPSLVEMVLSEYTEVEVVMDYLLELSTVAKRECQLESTGFENIAACLDGVQNNSQSLENEVITSATVTDKAEGYLDDQYVDKTACDDLDILLDEALDRYGLKNREDNYNAEQLGIPASEVSTSNVLSQQVQSVSPENTLFHGEYMENIAQPQISLAMAEEINSGGSLHECNDVSLPTKSSSELDANIKLSKGTNGSFIQNNKLGTTNSQGLFASSETPTFQKLSHESIQSVLTTQSNVSSVSPKSQIKWNPMASTFFPAFNQQGTFITPVVAKPFQWSYAKQPSGVNFCNAQAPSSYVWNPFRQTQRTGENVNPINVCKPKPQVNAQSSKKVTRLVGKVLIMLRGAPGSGKSTLARTLLEQNPTGVILSTDDYFYQNGQYQYDVNCLSEAHDWNHKRAKDAFEKNVSPIIIDNTNLQGWEMKPYVSMAMKHKYKVTFREPETWWKYKPKELERRNLHGIKKEKIMKMLDNFERVTVNSILNLSRSKAPGSADTNLLKSDETNRASNDLVKEANISTALETESKNLCGTDAAVVSADQSFVSNEEAKNSPETSLNKNESMKQNLEHTDDTSEKYSTLIQCFETFSIENQSLSSEICPQEVIADKEDNSDVGCHLSQLSQRPEFQSFVGDWPIEQTLSQRAPRSRKKNKPRCKSVQHPSEEEKALDCDSGQFASPEPVPKENFITIDTILETEASVASQGDGTDLQKNGMETPAFNNDENNASVGHKPDKAAVKSSEAFQQESQVAVKDINPDISCDTADMETSQTRPCKRSYKKCKLALTFNNSCSSNFRTDETLLSCELIENADQNSAAISVCTQTEPHVFAVAWRVEKKNMEAFESFKVLTGKADRFKSQSLEGNNCSQENIPYRMMHHKSTFVEEDEIISVQEEDSLQTLSKMFRSLSFDVLKDLFERCNNDLEWATNLLLDSGEKIYKDEYDQDEWLEPEDNCEHLEDFQEDDVNPDGSPPTDDQSKLPKVQCASFKMDDNSIEESNYSSLENCTLVNTVPLVVAEELKNGNVLSSTEVNQITNQCTMLDRVPSDQHPVPDTIEAHMMWSSSLEGGQFSSQDPTLSMDIETNNMLNDKTINRHITQGFQSSNDEKQSETDDHVDDILTDNVSENQGTSDVQRGIANKPQKNSLSQPRDSLKFDHLEFSLPPELAYQLTELFGPVGIDPGSLTIEDCLVPIDLKLAEAIHQKWKQSILEKHNQEALSYQLLLEDFSTSDHINLDSLLQEQQSGLVGQNAVVSQGETDMFPFMDQWNTRIKKVSLRQIMSEEMALQAREDMKKPKSTNCAVKLKEKQLLERFPNLEQNLLMDILKENNYSLEKTEKFFSSALEADPVQNVVAPGFKQEVLLSTDKTKRAKFDKEDLSERYFQDLESPEYQDFRAEAILYHQKQQESYRKAAEAHNRGMKQVATYYAQQGYLYGQKMKEENHRAAVQIFERANEYLLAENILDLHGLHVDEAMKHLRRVLQEKTEDYKQNGGSPHLLVITGRGNRSQGGIPRIKPAVIDYLKNRDYRFQEKTPGALRIMLK